MSRQLARGALLIRCTSRAYRVRGVWRGYPQLMLRSAILAASRSTRVERLVETAPLTRDVVRRFVAGTDTDDALRVTRELAAAGLRVTLDYLGEDTLTPDQAAATKDEYLRLLKALADAGLTGVAEVSLKLSALGQRFDEELAYEHA